MEAISREFHFITDAVESTLSESEEPLLEIVAVSEPDGKFIMVGDRAVLRASITRIELDEPDDAH